MKGITLLSDVFLLIVLLAVIVFMSIFAWSLIITFEAESRLGMITPRTVELNLFFRPVKYDNTLLAFLELEYEGIKVKKIINAIPIQNSTVVWLGKFIDTENVCKNLSQMISNDFILKIKPKRSSEIIVCKKGTTARPPVKLTFTQKIVTEIFLLNGESAELQLFVFE